MLPLRTSKLRSRIVRFSVVLTVASGLPLAALATPNKPGGTDNEMRFGSSSYKASCNKRLAGLLTPEILEGLRDREIPPQLRALHNSVQKIGFKEATGNPDIIREHMPIYSHELPQAKVPDQMQSGRCWLFAECSSQVNKLFAEGKVDKHFQLSQSYLHFFNQLEKFNKWTNDRIRSLSPELVNSPDLRMAFNAVHAVDDGGYYEFAEFLIRRHGLVPRDVFPETAVSANTTYLLAHLQSLAGDAAAQILAAYKAMGSPKKLSAEQLQYMHWIREQATRNAYESLRAALGTPPKTFRWRLADGTEKEFTPQSFAREFVGFRPHRNVVVGASPFEAHPKNVVLTLPNSSIGVKAPHEQGDIRVLNVSEDRLLRLVVKSILEKKEPVWFAADVTKDVDYATGIMKPGIHDASVALALKPEERLPAAGKASSTFLGTRGADHAMLFTGVDIRGGKIPLMPDGQIDYDALMPLVVKLKVENSWDKVVGTKGNFHMYPDWFGQYTYEVVVPAEVLSAEERAATKKPALPLMDSEFPF